MSEADIRSVFESSKLNKATKPDTTWKKNDIKYELLEKQISNLKNEYENKINKLEIIIQKTQKTHMEVYRKQTADNSIKQKINLLHKKSYGV